jgi:hypothetical protein
MSDPILSNPGTSRITLRILTYLSATWCGFVFLFLGAVLTFMCGRGIYRGVANEPHDVVELVFGTVLIHSIVGFLAFVLGVAFGRFLLRAIPPHLSGPTDRRRFAILALAVCVGLGSFFMLILFLIVLELAQLRTPDGPARFWPYLMFTGLPAMFWTAGAVGPVLLRHRTPRAFLDRPFVLFLRRFSTFSDRAVIALVLKHARPGVPVVFLTPTLSRPKDWDPYIVGFAGLNMSYPFRSAPMVLRARDDDWRRAATELIDRAEAILVDTSEASTALQIEAEMIRKSGRWSNTTCLRHAPSAVRSQPESLGAFSNARCIDYSKSWIRALPRLIVFVPIALSAALSLGALVALLFGGRVVHSRSPRRRFALLLNFLSSIN